MRTRPAVAVDEVHDRVLGFVSVDVAGAFIHHLFVVAECRSRGIGRALLAALRDEILPPWRLKCVRLNTAALRFHARPGWRETGGGESDHGAYAVLEFHAPA